MFTGIVQEQLTILNYQAGDPTVVTLALPQWGALEIGESVLLHGICTTVVTCTDEVFTVELMAETLQCTNASQWRVGQRLHAEPSATVQTKLSGNLVYGHVDIAVPVLAVQGSSISLVIPERYQDFVINKGAITINGVNLTITDATPGQCTVQLIPHTAAVTTLLSTAVGDHVNVEFDHLTKVIVQTVQRHPLSAQAKKSV